MTELLTRLAEIRQRQGLPPINPNVISGFGPDDPPPVPSGEPDLPDERFPEDQDDLRPSPERAMPPSPLLELGKTAAQPAAKLIILDSNAAYAGQRITLSEREQGAVVRIVLLAMRRQLKEQLRALEARLPERARRTRTVEARGESEAGAVTPLAEPRPKRRYVRRKTALKP